MARETDIHLKYWAFISYSHSDNQPGDRNWASWLHREIERYDVPSDLVGTRNTTGETVPNRLFPVFLDESELTPHPSLKQSIRTALDESRNLIVLCSPNAAKSRHVVAEIEYFLSLGRDDRVIPVILEGHPERQTCFPSPLLDSTGDEPLAADFRTTEGAPGFTSPEGLKRHLENSAGSSGIESDLIVEEYAERSQQAKLGIIAAILGIPIDRLVQRDRRYRLDIERRKTRVLRRWLSLVSVLGVIAISAAVFANFKRLEADMARADAEDLVEFLQNDAHSELGKLGRLDIMESLNRKIFAYLDRNAQTLSGFQARVRATAEFQSGMDALRVNRAEAAQNHFAQAMTASQQATEMEGREDWLDIAAVANWRSAEIDFENDNADRAIQKLRTAGTLADRVLAVDPENLFALSAKYGHSFELVRMKSSDGDLNAALVDLRELISWVESNPSISSAPYQTDHVLLYLELSRLSDSAGMRQEAFAAATRASEMISNLSDSDSSDAVKAETFLQLTRLHALSGNSAAALQQLDRALFQVERRLERAPKSTEAMIQAIETNWLLASLQLNNGLLQSALQTLSERSAYARRLHMENSLAPRGIKILVECLTYEASILADGNFTNDAILILREAEDTLRFAISAGISHPDNQSWQMMLSELGEIRKGIPNAMQ